MTYFVCYDITHDKTRTKIAKYLEQKGGVRVQKSIFLFLKLDAGERAHLKGQLEAYLQKHQQETDNILLIPVESKQLKQMLVIGNNEVFDDEINPTLTFFF